MKSFLLLFLVFCAACTPVGQKSRQATLGRDPTWFPVSLDHVTVNVNGFTNALLEKLSLEGRVKWVVVDVSWNQLLEGLKSGDYAGIVTGLTPDLVTKEYYDFSEPFLALGPLLVVPAASPVHNLAGLADAMVGIYQYDDSVLIAQKIPSIVMVPYQEVTDVLVQVAEGKLGGALVPSLDAKRLVPSLYADRLKIVTGPLSSEGLRLVVPKGKGDFLLDAFNKGIRALEKKGTYQQLLRDYSVE